MNLTRFISVFLPTFVAVISASVIPKRDETITMATTYQDPGLVGFDSDDGSFSDNPDLPDKNTADLAPVPTHKQTMIDALFEDILLIDNDIKQINFFLDNALSSSYDLINGINDALVSVVDLDYQVYDLQGTFGVLLNEHLVNKDVNDTLTTIILRSSDIDDIELALRDIRSNGANNTRYTGPTDAIKSIQNSWCNQFLPGMYNATQGLASASTEFKLGSPQPGPISCPVYDPKIGVYVQVA